jgi:HAD superfamily hydrolase (TIGR01509 family)
VIRAFLFDCDGTLADNEPLHYRALAEALLADGIRLGVPEYRLLTGLPDGEAVRAALRGAGRETGDAKVGALVEAKRAAYRRALAAGLVPVPGMADFVRRASSSYPLALATGAWRDEAEAVLAGLGVADCFRAVVTQEDCAKGKPDPEPFLRALAALNAADPAPSPPLGPRDCLVFEDSPHGVAAARAAGMRCVALTTSHTGADLRDADLVAAHYRALDLGRMTAFFDRRAR